MASSGHPDNFQMVERFIWSVLLDDGTVISEYPSPTEHRSFADVPRDRVVALTVSPNAWLGHEGPSYVVQCDPETDVRPVMFRKVALDVQSGTIDRWHVFGTQRKIHGTSVESFCYISNSDEQGTETAPVIMTHTPLEVG